MAEKGHAISFDRTWDAIKKDDWYESPGRDDEIGRGRDPNMVKECVNVFLSTLAPMFENSDQDSYVAEAVSHHMGRPPTQDEVFAARDEATRLLENFTHSVREQID